MDYEYDYTLSELSTLDPSANTTNYTDGLEVETSRSPVEPLDPVAEFLDSSGWKVTRILLYSLAIVTIIVSNILLLVVIRKVHYLKTSSNRYVVTLAVSDIILGLYTILKLVETVVPASVAASLYLCLGIQLGWICLSTVSQVLVLYLCLDCYFSLWHPITYSQVLTSCKASGAIFAAWIYAGAVALVPLTWVEEWEGEVCRPETVVIHRYLIFLLVHFCTILTVALVVFLFVHYEVHTSKVVLKVYKKRRKQKQVYEERRKKDVQNARCMSIITALYFSFWLLYFVTLAINMHYARTPITSLLEQLAVILVILHSCINPAVYVCKLHTFQIACYKVLCCIFSRHFPSRPPSDSVQLRSLSFRNQATGSMMSLHTTIGNDGKVVRVPQLVISDYDRSVRAARHRMPVDGRPLDIWCVPESPEVSPVRGERYRHKSKGTMNTLNSLNNITLQDQSNLTESDDHLPYRPQPTGEMYRTQPVSSAEIYRPIVKGNSDCSNYRWGQNLAESSRTQSASAEVYRPHESSNIELYRPQPVSNTESYRPQQSSNIEIYQPQPSNDSELSRPQPSGSSSGNQTSGQRKGHMTSSETKHSFNHIGGQKNNVDYKRAHYIVDSESPTHGKYFTKNVVVPVEHHF